MNGGHLRHARPVDAVVDDEHFALGVQRGCDGGLQGGRPGAGQQDSCVPFRRGERPTEGVTYARLQDAELAFPMAQIPAQQGPGHPW
jgi:hypothetical protein